MDYDTRKGNYTWNRFVWGIRVVKSHNRVAEAVYREGGCDSESLKV
jgi:hypothetical protein